MKTIKMLGSGLLDTVVGLLTFNLPMSRVTHRDSSAPLVIAIAALSVVLLLVQGDIFPAALLGLMAVAIGVDQAMLRRVKLPDQAPARFSRVIALGYVVAMTSTVESMVRILGSFLAPDANLWIGFASNLWAALIMILMFHRVEKYQATEALAGPTVSPNAAATIEATGGDSPESKKP